MVANLKSFIRNAIWKFADPLLLRCGARLSELNEMQQINELRLNADIRSNVVFYPESKIFNFRGVRESICVQEGCRIRGELLVFWDDGRISFGSNCYLGGNSRIWSQSSVTIGNNVLISHMVDIHDTNSHPINYIDRRADALSLLQQNTYLTPTKTQSSPIVIEDDAWIGFKATILKGVTIGRGAIVASSAVVTHNVEPFTIVVGNPAKAIRRLEEADV